MTKEEYESFIGNINNNLNRLQDIVRENGFENWSINYEKESTESLEEAYIQLLDRDVLFHHVDMDLLIMTYIGEASIHHLGGKWAYGDKDGTLGFEQAVIVEYKNWGGVPISPKNKISRIKEREGKKFIWKTIDFALNKEIRQNELMDQMRNLGKKKK